MFFDLNKLGGWLGNRLGKRAVELTDDDLQQMTKDQLISSIKELQSLAQKQDYQLKKKSDQLFNLFVRMKF